MRGEENGEGVSHLHGIWEIVMSSRSGVRSKTVLLSRVSILLLTRDIDIVILSVCPSVFLSVTRWYCMKTA